MWATDFSELPFTLGSAATSSSTLRSTERNAMQTQTLVKHLDEPVSKHSSKHVCVCETASLKASSTPGLWFHIPVDLNSWLPHPVLGPALFSSVKATAADLRGHCIYRTCVAGAPLGGISHSERQTRKCSGPSNAIYSVKRI